MVYMVTYDLCSPGQNYEKVIEAIKDASTGAYRMICESSYLIKSYLTAQQIVDKIKPYFDSNDRLLVIEVTNKYQGLLTNADWKYLRESIF